MWTACRYLQVLAYVEGKGVHFISSSKASCCHIQSVMVTTPHSFFFQSTLKGTVGFEQHIDKCLDLSAYLYNKIKNREGYEMVFNGEVRPLFPQTANIANNQIYPVLSYRMNINWFIRY